MHDFIFLNVGLCNEVMEFPKWMIYFARMKYITFSFEQLLDYRHQNLTRLPRLKLSSHRLASTQKVLEMLAIKIDQESDHKLIVPIFQTVCSTLLQTIRRPPIIISQLKVRLLC